MCNHTIMMDRFRSHTFTKTGPNEFTCSVCGKQLTMGEFRKFMSVVMGMGSSTDMNFRNEKMINDLVIANHLD